MALTNDNTPPETSPSPNKSKSTLHRRSQPKKPLSQSLASRKSIQNTAIAADGPPAGRSPPRRGAPVSVWPTPASTRVAMRGPRSCMAADRALTASAPAPVDMVAAWGTLLARPTRLARVSRAACVAHLCGYGCSVIYVLSGLWSRPDCFLGAGRVYVRLLCLKIGIFRLGYVVLGYVFGLDWRRVIWKWSGLLINLKKACLKM